MDRVVTVRYGLSVTGAGGFRSTSAIGVFGEPQMWNRGITFANNCVVQSTFQDLGNPAKSVDIRGNPSYGVYQSSQSSKNYFAGKTGVGLASDPEVTLDVGGDVQVTGRLLQRLKTKSQAKRNTVHAVVTRFGTDAGEATHRGRLVLDHRGEGRIPLPTDWEELTVKDTATITTTPIGVPMPNLHVVDDSDSMFILAGGVAGRRVHYHISASFVHEE